MNLVGMTLREINKSIYIHGAVSNQVTSNSIIEAHLLRGKIKKKWVLGFVVVGVIPRHLHYSFITCLNEQDG